MGKHDDAQRIEFASRQEWRDWLHAHHATSTGVFVIYFKKSAKRDGPTYEDLIEEALCVGWVDGTLRTVDDERTSLWFCPRRKGSMWAASNKSRVQRLRDEGLMTTAGEVAVDRAIADGSWTVLERSDALEVPAELAGALARRPGGRQAFDALRPSARKQFIYQVDSAKRRETRERRAEDIARAVCGQ